MKASKLTARGLAYIVRAAGRKIGKAHRSHQRPHGRQTVRQLMAHGEATSSIPVDAPALFDRVARKWNVDYAFYQTEPDKYLLFFKGKQADAITACMSEYSKRVLGKEKSRRVPILEQLKKAKAHVRQQPQREQERMKEAVPIIKKVLLPNLPYLFFLWAFLKIGTAYRLAEGADFAHKLIGLGRTIGPAFADFAPGLHPFDWLVGIAGAVILRLVVYVKAKKASKYRRDEEYGSARWSA